MTVVHIDLPQRIMRWKRRGWDLYWYYALWQRLAGRTAERLHAEVEFDVVHHVSFANDWMPCGVAKLGVPMVWGPVGGASRLPLMPLRRWLGGRGMLTELARTTLTAIPRRIWGDASARRAAIVVAQNPDVARRFRRARSVVVEPNAAFTGEIPEHRGSEDGHTAVFAGRLLAWKGAALAIEAIAQRAASGWRLIVLGEGYELPRLRRLAHSLGVPERVDFRGHVSREVTLQTLAGSDALLFPSMHDQAGWIVGEASAMGLPVVCLDLGGPPTLAGINGHVVAARGGDLPGRLASALRDSAASPARPHDRWDAARLPSLVEGWYADAVAVGPATELAVMESLSRPRPTTNPYLIQLCQSLQRTPGIELSYFSWRRALFGEVDVFHVHWPELLMGGHRRSGRVARRLLTTAFLLRILITRVAVVRTLHNLERPSGLGRIDRLLLTCIDRLTTSTVTLNETTPVSSGQAHHTVLHGHYRDWFAHHPRHDARTGRVAYLGLIRRYKGVEQLIRAFLDWDSPDATLAVAGRPSTDELRHELQSLAGDDERISLAFRFLDDAELVARISESQLVVLPYRHMHNSGTVLAALSLDRPVLIPDNAVNRALADEVGDQWVHLFEGDLQANDLRLAMEATRAPRTSVPDLTRREWTAVGAQHAVAFRHAAALRRGRR
ncbi:glycosyltransferase family 4 protein [Microbacterium sp. OR16]|uniref:glycosyltransferase family 4 protein n=1 Tax=Microbacterium sp. OR16 TaxID=3095345 RepID=UPI0039B63577